MRLLVARMTLIMFVLCVFYLDSHHRLGDATLTVFMVLAESLWHMLGVVLGRFGSFLALGGKSARPADEGAMLDALGLRVRNRRRQKVIGAQSCSLLF